MPGNHDRIVEEQTLLCREILKQKIKNSTMLIDEEFTLNGIKFYGSPRTPEFFDWAFMYKRGKKAELIWSNIPDDTDILITHGPPKGILDKVGFDFRNRS